MKCLLCKANEANQTGAHIFTNSLVKNCVNVEGKTGRDDELMFGFSQSGEKHLYVGNTTSTNKIEEVVGRPLTDEELDDNSNEFVVDNIYCRDCEKLFGKIESPFTDRVLKKIREEGVYEFDAPDNVLIRLYFFIQIWRASSYGYNDWKLSNPKVEEQLRTIILKGCTQIDSGFTQDLIDEIISFPLIINFLETSKGNKSSNLMFIPNETKPYLFFLCDFIVEFFQDDSKVDTKKISNYFGLNNGLTDNFINHNEEEFKIRFIANKEAKVLKNTIVRKEFVKGETERFIKKFIRAYISRTKSLPSQNKIKQFQAKYFAWENIPIFQRTSDERFDRILNEIIKSD